MLAAPRVKSWQDAKWEEEMVSPEGERSTPLRAMWDLSEEEKPAANTTGTNESLGREGTEVANTGSAFQHPCW